MNNANSCTAASVLPVVYLHRSVEIIDMENVPKHSVIVWFDGACPLCRREIDFMRKLDRKNAIKFIEVMTADTQCPVDRETLLVRFHAQEDGCLLSGAAAFAAMWRAIPILRPLGLAAQSSVVLAGLERGYIFFLRFRPKLQRFATWLEKGVA